MVSHTLAVKSRIVTYAAALVLMFSFASNVWGQLAVRRPNVQTELLDVFPPAPRDLKQRLRHAREALDEKRYSDAVDHLGRILVPEKDDSDTLDPEGEDYFIGLTGETGTRTSLKAEAQRLLGTMPAKGRESFELQYGADARSLLDQAVRDGDIQKLTDATRMYFHTKAGYEAAMVLGRYHLDHGRPLAGAMCFQRIAESPAASQYDPEASILLATCWLYANSTEKAKETLLALRDRNVKTPLKAGGQDYEFFKDPKDALPWLTKLVGQPPVAGAQETSQWLVHRGSATRNARASGSLPLKEFRWRVPTANDPVDEKGIENFRTKYREDKVPALPGVHPLAVENVVLMRTADELLAVDFRTGKRIWVFPWSQDASLHQQFAGDSRTPRSIKTSPRDSELNQRLWDDAPHGQISSDGERVFVLNELGSAVPNGNPVMLRPGGFVQPNSKWPRSHNKLVALSLSRQGALLWVVGGTDGVDEPKLAGAFFLGAPMPLLGQLYVLAELNGEIRLIVLDRKTGHLEWSQQLAYVENHPIQNDGPRRLAGASPSFADGVLVCPTSTGAVVAVDLSTRSLLWGFQYKKAVNYQRHSLNRVYTRETRPVGNRWADGTATIADGRVILTPVESERIFCLDLLTGKSLWKDGTQEGKARGEDLYVGCVDDGKVVVIGKNGVEGRKLDDGESAWTVKFDDGAMPSGRGFFSGGHYYLPTTQSRLVKVDVAAGKVAEDMETEYPLGNLICYKGEIISHGTDWLAAFHQEKPLRASVRERLKKDANDVWALARQGELLLHDGKQHEALSVIRRAYELDQSSDRTRGLLVRTMLDALRDDYATNQKIIEEVEGLIDQPSRRAEFLRIKTMGLFKAGRTLEAFAAFEAMAGLNDKGGFNPLVASRIQQIDQNLNVSNDRWIMARLAELHEKADGAGRDHIDSRIASRLNAALHENDSGGLRQFLNSFGFHPIADRARLALAAKLIKSGDLLEAELLATSLAKSNDDAVRASAAAQLAQMLVRSERFEEAAAQYRMLAEQWGDVECLEGKTGKQLFESIPTEGTLGRMLGVPVKWAEGKAEISPGAEMVDGRSPSYYRVYPIDLREIRGPAPHGIKAEFDQRAYSVVIRDGRGSELLRFPLNQAGSTNRFSTTNFAVTHGQVNGHVLILSMGYELIAVDLLQAARGGSDAILWRHDLGRTIPNPLIRTTTLNRVGSKTLQNPWGTSRYQATDANGRLVGATGSLSANGFCFLRQRELVCVDPLTGATIWSRSDIQPGSDLFGDDQHVFVTPPDDKQASVFNLIDGSFVGRREIAPLNNRWTTCGRRVLSWKQVGSQLELLLNDALEQSTIWKRSFPMTARGWIIENEEVAVMQPGGEFEILSMLDGKVILDTKVHPEKNLTNIYVLRSSEQYILATNNPSVADEKNSISAAPGGFHSPLVNGRVYAFDRRTGRSQWEMPVYVSQFGLPLDQTLDVPLLTFLRHVTPKTRGSQTRQTEIMWIDKRDGRVVKWDKEIRAHTSSYQIQGHLSNQMMTVRIPGKTFTIKFTKEPKPPADTNATSAAKASLPKSKGSKLSTSIAKALGKSIERLSGVPMAKEQHVLRLFPEIQAADVFESPTQAK